MQEFLARGYAAASMDRVASIAGVSKATVYSHFGDKEGLFKALVESMAKQRMQAIMSKWLYTVAFETPAMEATRSILAAAYPRAKNSCMAPCKIWSALERTGIMGGPGKGIKVTDH